MSIGVVCVWVYVPALSMNESKVEKMPKGALLVQCELRSGATCTGEAANEIKHDHQKFIGQYVKQKPWCDVNEKLAAWMEGISQI